MAATAAELSSARDTVYGLRRLFIHRFPIVNAIAGVIFAISLTDPLTGDLCLQTPPVHF